MSLVRSRTLEIVDWVDQEVVGGDFSNLLDAFIDAQAAIEQISATQTIERYEYSITVLCQVALPPTPEEVIARAKRWLAVTNAKIEKFDDAISAAKRLPWPDSVDSRMRAASIQGMMSVRDELVAEAIQYRKQIGDESA